MVVMVEYMVVIESRVIRMLRIRRRWERELTGRNNALTSELSEMSNGPKNSAELVG